MHTIMFLIIVQCNHHVQNSRVYTIKAPVHLNTILGPIFR